MVPTSRNSDLSSGICAGVGGLDEHLTRRACYNSVARLAIEAVPAHVRPRGTSRASVHLRQVDFSRRGRRVASARVAVGELREDVLYCVPYGSNAEEGVKHLRKRVAPLLKASALNCLRTEERCMRQDVACRSLSATYCSPVVSSTHRLGRGRGCTSPR